MIELYYSQTCPYCQKVLSFFKENDIDFKAKDVSDPINYAELIKIGKIAQVPFLFDREKDEKMYESDIIIDYVNRYYKK